MCLVLRGRRSARLHPVIVRPASSVLARRMQSLGEMRAKLMIRTLAAMACDESGQDLIEYALLAGLVSLVAVAAVVNVGSGVNGVWVGVDSQVSAIPSP